MKTMLQKYFSGFTTTTTNDDGQAQGPVSDAFMCQKIYQVSEIRVKSKATLNNFDG